MQLPPPEAISDSVLLEQLGITFQRPIPTYGRLSQLLGNFLDAWFIAEWSAQIDAKQTVDTPSDIRDHAQRVLERMFPAEGMARLVSNTIRSLVDERAEKLEDDSKKHFQQMTYEQIEEEC